MSNAINPIEYIKTVDLHFDPENPRFYRLHNASDRDVVIQEMLDDESAQDLMRSIGQKGYFPGEPLLVARHELGLIVVEGNRRLAAVKLLNGDIPPPRRRASSLQDIKDEIIVSAPTELPCIVYNDRKDVLRYLGYRHITGVKEWDALSKAKYLDELRSEFYDDQHYPDQLKSLAKDIGSRPDYVGQLLCALNLYIKAESQGFYQLPLNSGDIEFSYITTALSYRSISDWLGLADKTDVEAINLNEDCLKKLLSWMFVRDANGDTVLGETRRLKEMAEVVRHSAAVEVLQENRNLGEAYLYTDGPAEALGKAFDDAQGKLKILWNMLLEIKADMIASEHLDLAESLADQAKKIRSQIRDILED